MSKKWKNDISGIRNVEVIWNEPLSRHTTYRVGGVVTCIAYPLCAEATTEILKILKLNKVPYFILGKGSNLLVADELPEMVAINLEKGATKVELKDTKGKLLVEAGAGVSVARLMRLCIKEGLEGLEFLLGIPGSVGGAVVMNAGTSRGEISEVLEDVTIVTHRGSEKIPNKEIKFSYRKTEIPTEGVVWSVTLRAKKSEKEMVRRQMLEILKKRMLRQPVPKRTAGSVFKNPPDDYAGRLIEKAGLKGKVLGGAKISEKHANWIVTTQGAKASDVHGLLRLVQKTVQSKFGVRLEPEIKLVGFD